MKPIVKIACLLVVGFGAAFAQQAKPSGGGAATAFTLTSSAFAPGAAIPEQYSCKGADTSPALEWSGAPANVASFALIMDDPDAPGGTWVHWVLWNLPATAQSLPQGVPKREQLDNGARQGKNSFRKIGYNGPCPPAGATHRYFFRVVCAGWEARSGRRRQPRSTGCSDEGTCAGAGRVHGHVPQIVERDL